MRVFLVFVLEQSGGRIKMQNSTRRGEGEVGVNDDRPYSTLRVVVPVAFVLLVHSRSISRPYRLARVPKQLCIIIIIIVVVVVVLFSALEFTAASFFLSFFLIHYCNDLNELQANVQIIYVTMFRVRGSMQ